MLTIYTDTGGDPAKVGSHDSDYFVVFTEQVHFCSFTANHLPPVSCRGGVCVGEEEDEGEISGHDDNMCAMWCAQGDITLMTEWSDGKQSSFNV